MTSKIKIFYFENNCIRSIQIDKTIWFLAKDVAKSLGYVDKTHSILRNVSKHNRLTLMWKNFPKNNKSIIWNKNDRSNKTFVNKPGLYSMTFHSKFPQAKRFYDWVINAVLPNINNNSVYDNSKIAEEWLNNPDMMITILTKYKNTKKKLKEYDLQRKNILDFYKNIGLCKGNILVGDMAKLLNKNGINTGQKRFFKWLRKNHYLISHHGLNWNSPTSRSLNSKIMTVKEKSKSLFDGSKIIFKTPLITDKGQRYFYEKLIKKVNNK